MKKIILFSILLSAIFSLNAQTLYEELMGSKFGEVLNVANQYWLEKENTVEILDENLSVTKNITSLPSDYKYVYMVFNNYFTTSGKCELLYVMNNGTYQLYNGDGELMFNFEAYYPVSIRSKFITTEVSQSGDERIYRAYNIAGNVSTQVNPLSKLSSSSSYPNPARNVITITYDVPNMVNMTVVSVDGRHMDNVLLDSYQSEYMLDISSYPAGNYIYKYGETTGKFIVK